MFGVGDFVDDAWLQLQIRGASPKYWLQPLDFSTIIIMATHMANYVNPESRVWEVMSVVIVCSVVSTTLMSARLYVRVKMLHSAGWDDIAAASATVSSPPKFIC